MDFDGLRESLIAAHGLYGVNEAYTPFYDETNNIRRLHVRPEGLNEADPKCFVAGGVGLQDTSRTLDTALLLKALRLQPSVRELKLKHLAKGEFLDLINSPKIQTFLSWLVEQRLLVHYSVMDPVNWAFVDILDSIYVEAREPLLLGWIPRLKSALCMVLRAELQRTVDLFRRFSYPDITPTNKDEFLDGLLTIVSDQQGRLSKLDHAMLKGTLERGYGLERLPFIEGRVPNLLVDEFYGLYLQRVLLFKNAQHIFDAEDTVRNKFEEIGDQEPGTLPQNYRFVVSHDEPGVQVSDVFVGVLGKLFVWVCSTGTEELACAKMALTDQQERNRRLLSALIDSSLEICPAFIHSVLSQRDIEQVEFFLE